jgi:hypothetical protein
MFEKEIEEYERIRQEYQQKIEPHNLLFFVSPTAAGSDLLHHRG